MENREKYYTPHIKAVPGDFGKTVLMPGDPLRAKFIAETYLENRYLRDEDSVEMIDILYDGIIYDMAMIFEWGSVVNLVNTLPIKDTGFSSTYAAKEPAILAALEGTVKKLKGEE